MLLPRPDAPTAHGPALGAGWKVLRSLGRGTMGEVFEATSPTLGRMAVKVLHAHLEDRPDIADRMRLEAEILAHLRHPNIVRLHEVGATEDGRPFLAMEYIPGPTLLAALKTRGRVPPAEAVAIACEVLAALAAAHEAGVIHRDVKPGNVFLLGSRPGEAQVKLVDFGVAKLLMTVGAGGKAPAPLLVPTAEGTVVGTPRYLSPEQIAGRPVDARADLYAVGLVLYRMLVGRGPFDAIEDFADLMRAQVQVMPLAPSCHGIALPRPLDLAVLKALAKRPEDRFSSAAEFAQELVRSFEPEAVHTLASEMPPGASPEAGAPDEADLETTLALPHRGAAQPPTPAALACDAPATVGAAAPAHAGAEVVRTMGPWAMNRLSVVLAALLGLTWLGLAVNWVRALASEGR